MMIAAGTNNAFAINGFTGLTTAQIFSFFMVFIVFNGFVVLEAAALAAFFITSKPRHGRVRSAAIWHFVAAVLVMFSFVTTVWAAPAEKTFVDATRTFVSLNQPPNITVGGFPVTRAEMLFIGIAIAAVAVLCMLVGFMRGGAQKRLLREELYATA